MSIIHEALQKVGSGKIHAAKTANTPQSSKGPSVSERPVLSGSSAVETLGRKSSFNWGPIFVILVLTFITGPVISPLFSTPAKLLPAGAAAGLARPDRQTGQVKTLSLGDDRLAQFAVEEIPRPAMPAAAAGGAAPVFLASTPDFFLSGIVFSTSKAYCLINEKIVRAGDVVGDATVKSIAADKVVLDYQGRQIILTTSV